MISSTVAEQLSENVQLSQATSKIGVVAKVLSIVGSHPNLSKECVRQGRGKIEVQFESWFPFRLRLNVKDDEACMSLTIAHLDVGISDIEKLGCCWLRIELGRCVGPGSRNLMFNV